MCVGMFRSLMHRKSGRAGYSAPSTIIVSGAGTSEVNGIYAYSGIYNGKKRFFKHNGDPIPSYGHYVSWDGSQQVIELVGGAIIALYTNPSTADVPEETGWVSTAFGDDPAPTIAV